MDHRLVFAPAWPAARTFAVVLATAMLTVAAGSGALAQAPAGAPKATPKAQPKAQPKSTPAPPAVEQPQAQGQAEQLDDAVLLPEFFELTALPVELNVPSGFDADVEGGTFCLQVRHDGLIAKPSVKD